MTFIGAAMARVSDQDVVRALGKIGYQWDRQHGMFAEPWMDWKEEFIRRSRDE